jgi:hypothetical protein
LPYKHLQELPDDILLIYRTSNGFDILNPFSPGEGLTNSFKQSANADNPEDDEANPLPVGNELNDVICT